MVPGYVYTIFYIIISIVAIVNLYGVIFEKGIRIRSFLGVIVCSAGLFATYLFSSAEERNDPDCRADLHCWGRVYLKKAESACVRLIEKEASLGYEWLTEGLVDRKFSHFGWDDQEKGVIVYAGDKLRFQRRNGTWRNMTYECEFDTMNEAVLDVDVDPGFL